MFYVLLALEGILRGRIFFKMDQLVNVIALGMSSHSALSVFVNTANEIVGDADVNCAPWPARKDINEEPPHSPSFDDRDGRDKPGHDGIEIGGKFNA